MKTKKEKKPKRASPGGVERDRNDQRRRITVIVVVVERQRRRQRGRGQGEQTVPAAASASDAAAAGQPCRRREELQRGGGGEDRPPSHGVLLEPGERRDAGEAHLERRRHQRGRNDGGKDPGRRPRDRPQWRPPPGSVPQGEVSKRHQRSFFRDGEESVRVGAGHPEGGSRRGEERRMRRSFSFRRRLRKQ